MMNCEQFDREALENVGFKLAALSRSLVVDPELQLLQRDVLAKLVVLGGGPIAPIAPANVSNIQSLREALEQHVGDQRLCAHTRNFFQIALLRLERVAYAA